jgi:hypothetical protein
MEETYHLSLGLGSCHRTHLHIITNNKKILLEIFYENLLKDWSLAVVQKIQVHIRSGSWPTQGEIIFI